MPEEISMDGIKLELAPLNPDNPVPLYHQLYTAISEKIQSGTLPIGSKVPSEMHLAGQLDISRITVKRALNELAQSGLVTRQRGRGTIVTANTDLNFKGGVNDYVKNVAMLRKTTDAEILEREIVSAPKSVAANLGLAPNTRVEKILHRLSLKGEILSYVVTYVPHGLSEQFSEGELEHEPLLTLLMKSGVHITRAEQKIFAVSADQQDMRILGTRPDRPLLKIHCVMFDTDNRAVEDIYAWYHPDRYQYQMTLTGLSGPDIDQPQRR